MNFTAHNIRFADGSSTIPSVPEMLADSPRCRSFKRLISTVYRGQVHGKRVADLGCLEGGYTVEFARMGMEALGVEVRASNIENCHNVQRRAGLPNLRFEQDTVWNIGKFGSFDVTLCSGILYHLDRPREFVRLLGEVTRDLIIIDTHVANESDKTDFALSELVLHEGLIGRWYHEHDVDDVATLDTLKWASWNNKRSFWLTKESLLQAIRDAGFDVVLEQYDGFTDGSLLDALTQPAYRSYHRGIYIGVRSPG